MAVRNEKKEVAYAILKMTGLSDDVINQVHRRDSIFCTPFHGFVLHNWETEKISLRVSLETVLKKLMFRLTEFIKME